MFIDTFIKAGNKSLWAKYDTRLVWYAPEVNDKATSIALLRISTINRQLSARMIVEFEASTRFSSAYYILDGVCKFKKDSVDLIETSKYSDDIGTWIGVTLC